MLQNYNFETAYQGNTYDGVTFTMPSESDMNLTGASIYMQLRKSPLEAVVAEFSTLNSKIVVLSQYVFSFVSQVITVDVGIYKYDILILFSDGRAKTYIGGTFTVESLNTRKP